MPRKEIVNLFEYVLHKLNSELGEATEGRSGFWRHNDVSALQEAIDSFDTVEDLMKRCRLLLADVFSRMLEWREQHGNHALIDRAKSYIALHYGDDALSLNAISDEFQMNPTNFSRSFKQGTGEKFVDYVARIRIEHAQKALAETDEPIQDIGVAVGYVHAVSFNRAFKKAVGMTPGEYRKRNQH